MLNPTLVIARKEIVDSLRDVRSIISALMYALMGPLVVLLVSIGTRAVSSGASLRRRYPTYSFTWSVATPRESPQTSSRS